MTRFIKTITAAAFAALVAVPASAGPDFEVDFHYDPMAAPGDTYKAFEKTARQACRKQYKVTKSGHYLAHARRIDRCRAELLEKVVAAVNDPMITAIHGGWPPEAIKLASTAGQ
ncbi:MAG: hypothetical protein WA989_03525 [Henriciella sp.]|uniref:hypothetical protein n=1 Tax=Henriciella sp. TaxID=1968823 RepID=UPI003C77A75D